MHTNPDRIGRRPRHVATSTGKWVSPKTRDIRWFEALQRHGDLPSPYLHAFTQGTHRNSDASDNRLTDLFHEDNTPHRGTYLARPIAQFQTFDPRQNFLVHGVNSRSLAVLPARANIPPRSNSYKHDLMRSCITASIHLACKQAGFEYGYGDDILTRFSLGRSFSVTYDYERKDGKIATRQAILTPDDMFSISFADGKRVLFIVEVDRGNEATESDNTENKSLAHSVLMYRELIGKKVYQEYFKRSLPIVVLFTFTSEYKMKATTDYLDRISADGNNYIAFRCFPEFGGLFHPPDVMQDIITSPWARAGKPPLTLANPYA